MAEKQLDTHDKLQEFGGRMEACPRSTTAQFCQKAF